MADDFFKNGDKGYSENLNDGVLVGNAFDWTLSIDLPTDNGGVFPNSSSVSKAKVCDVSITPNSNLSIGSTISNSSGSSQVYRLTLYPNFNRFGGFKSITLTADSGVTFYIANKGGNSPIANNLNYANLGNVPELKVLKEYDIVVTIPAGKNVSGLSMVLQSKSASVSASINPSNVMGLTSALDSKVNSSDLIDTIYPVGSIYMSVNSTSPQTLFGGTWEQLKDKFLLASGDTYSNGATGGSATVSLTQSQMPRHTHIQNAHNHTQNPHQHELSGSKTGGLTSGAYLRAGDGATRDNQKTDSATATNQSTTATNQYTGGTSSAQSASNGAAHENMPPYLAVYMWKRTA